MFKRKWDMKTKMWIVCAVLSLLVTFSAASFGVCGLVVVESDGIKTLVSDGKLKSVSMEEHMMMDLNKKTITVIDQSKKAASHGTIDEYCTAMQKMAQVMAQSMQEMNKQTMSDMSKSMPGSQSVMHQIKVERVGSGGSITGYVTDK